MRSDEPRASRPGPAVLGLFTFGAVLLGAELKSKSGGILPFDLGAPLNLTSAFPSCGTCHDPLPNANGPVRLGISAASLSIAPGSQVAAQVQVTGGPGLSLSGFCMETSGGTFTPGVTTKVSLFLPPTAIAHIDRQYNQWSFTFNAPTTPGPVLWTAAGQSVNNNNQVTGDSWGFWGPDSSVPGVPFRLYVNSTNVAAAGDGCPGSDGHVPILGAAADAAVGQVFTTDLINVPPGAVTVGIAGYSTTQWRGIPLPIDLASLGAAGCQLRVNVILMQFGVAGGSGSGGGALATAWPLPNDPTLRNQDLFFQSLVVDSGANPGSLTVSNAVRATVQ